MSVSSDPLIPLPVSADEKKAKVRVKVCILAAGYGTRLERDIKEDQTGEFKQLVGVPKPLVPIGDVPLLTRWLNLLRSECSSFLEPSKDIFIMGNSYNHHMLIEWSSQNGIPSENILNDGSTKNENRKGAVTGIHLVLKHLQNHSSNNNNNTAAPNTHDPSAASPTADSSPPAADDWSGLLIIGGDTLFYPDFSLLSLLRHFSSTSPPHHHSLILHYPVVDTRKNGILEVDSTTGLVTNFLEKPQPDQTQSRRACPCFYILTRQALERVEAYVHQSTTLEQVDAPGNLIRHLIQLNLAAGSSSLIPIEGISIRGRFDIGGLETYRECDEWFRKFEEEKKEATDAADES